MSSIGKNPIGIGLSVLGIGIIALAAVMYFQGKPDKGGTNGNGSGSTFSTNQVEPPGAPPATSDNKVKLPDTPPPPPPKTITRKRLEPEATKRLSESPQIIKTVFTTTGRGERADWGIKGMASFVLNAYVDVEAEILEKYETDLGEMKVVEKRTYTKVEEALLCSDVDLAISLDTLPVDEAFIAAQAVGSAFEFFRRPDIKVAIEAGTIATGMLLKELDGKSVRAILGDLGIDVSGPAESLVNEFVTEAVGKPLLQMRNIKGKSYHITYYQDKESGAPLRVTFTHADGSDIQTEEEWLVLRRANAFLDSNVVPDKSCSPGDSWSVDTEDFESMLDPFVDGKYSGEVKVERRDDNSDGNWILAVHPGSVSIVSDQGKTTGELRLEGGEAEVDSLNAYVKAMVVSGQGAMKNLTPHHLLFKARMEGMCNFRGVMTTEPKK